MQRLKSVVGSFCLVAFLMPAAASAAPPKNGGERKPDKPNLLRTTPHS